MTEETASVAGGYAADASKPTRLSLPTKGLRSATIDIVNSDTNSEIIAIMMMRLSQSIAIFMMMMAMA